MGMLTFYRCRLSAHRNCLDGMPEICDAPKLIVRLRGIYFFLIRLL